MSRNACHVAFMGTGLATDAFTNHAVKRDKACDILRNGLIFFDSLLNSTIYPLTDTLAFGKQEALFYTPLAPDCKPHPARYSLTTLTITWLSTPSPRRCALSMCCLGRRGNGLPRSCNAAQCMSSPQLAKTFTYKRYLELYDSRFGFRIRPRCAEVG
jgi:hypothetical protein